MTGAAIGAACAATAGSGCVLAAMAIGAAGGGSSSAVGQVGNGRKMNADSIILDASVGALFGAGGGRGINGPNNIARAYDKRVAFGPAKNHYNSGKASSKIPVHVHLEKSKAGLDFMKRDGTRKTKKLWGNWNE